MRLRAAALASLLAGLGCSHAKPQPDVLKGALLPWPVPDLDIARAVADGQPPSFLLELSSPDAAWRACPLDPQPPQAKLVSDVRRPPRIRSEHRDVFKVSQGPTLARALPPDLEDSIEKRTQSIQVTPICGRGERVAFSVSTYSGMEPDADWMLVMIRNGDGWKRESLTHAP